jgi:adenine-specific DNA-methyltransferase
LLNSQRTWKEDILYLDPPYNQRQYAPNYHLYETLVRYDDPKVEGTTGLRDYDDQKSDFCAKKKVLAFTEEVLKATRARLVLISYSSDGTMSLAEMEEMLCRLAYNGEVSVHVKAQRRYKADNSRDNDDSFLREYLFEILRPESII